MNVVIEVPAHLKKKVETWWEGHEVSFNPSGSKRAKFEMAFSEPVNSALVGLWDEWQEANVGTLTIRAD